MKVQPIQLRTGARCQFAATLLLATLPGFFLNALPAEAEEPDLTELSIEDLMDIEVTSVAKREQRISDAAAAVFVITADDIRTSGATTIPELLRMVPGLQVARINTNTWAITARGFNGIFANKLLVMIDGRSVYTPMFSGVYWDMQDVPLTSIERIEVIRGPGASLWGANAENGVINILTKKSSASQGLTVTAGGGDENRSLGEVVYGGQGGDGVSYRLYSRSYDWDNAKAAGQGISVDSWRGGSAGFRLDHDEANSSSTFSGDFYGGNEGNAGTAPILTPPFKEEASGRTNFSGGNLLARFGHKIEEKNTVEILGYFNRDYRFGAVQDSTVETYNIELQHRFEPLESNSVIWGVGYRAVVDEVIGRGPAAFPDKDNTLNLESVFVQDEIQLRDDLTFLVGSKLEHNDFTNWEVQPTARLAWHPNQDATLWTAVSRAVRTPSRAEEGVELLLDAGIDPVSGLPYAATFHGSPDFDSENLTAYEAGLRLEPSQHLSFDIAGFYNVYDDTGNLKVTASPPAPGGPLLINIDQRLVNEISIDSFGGEALVDWRAAQDLHLQIWYSYIDYNVPRSRPDRIIASTEGNSVHHQAGFRSCYQLTPAVEASGFLRYVDAVEAYSIPDYAELNLGLLWRLRPGLELSIWGNNLLHAEHQEYNSNYVNLTAAELERGFFARIVWYYDQPSG